MKKLQNGFKLADIISLDYKLKKKEITAVNQSECRKHNNYKHRVPLELVANTSNR